MSRYSDEERERIMAESYATLQRREELLQQQREREYLEEMNQPLEDRVAVWKREADEQTAREQRAVRERRRSERRGEPAPVDLDLKLAEAIVGERERTAALLAEIVATLAERQAEAVAAAINPLQLELAELKIANADLRVAVAELRVQQSGADQGKVLDLPPILRSRPN